MERFGVSAGDIIRIHSLHGEILGVAEPEPHLRMGTLSMSHCYGPNPDEPLDPKGQGGCTSRLIDANADFDPIFGQPRMGAIRSEEHTSELQSLMRTSYAVFCLTTKTTMSTSYKSPT